MFLLEQDTIGIFKNSKATTALLRLPSLPLKRDDTSGSHTLICEAKFENNRIVICPRRIRRRRNRVEQFNYVIGGMLRDAKKAERVVLEFESILWEINACLFHICLLGHCKPSCRCTVHTFVRYGFGFVFSSPSSRKQANRDVELSGEVLPSGQ